MKIIAVDPRNTVTVKEADIHLKITPGTDGALALAMAHVIIEENLYDKEFVEKYVHGFEEYKNYVRKFTPEKAQEITGADADLIVYPLFGFYDCPSYQWFSELPCSILPDCTYW